MAMDKSSRDESADVPLNQASDSDPWGDAPSLDELPPVEPPSAGFIIQLFVVPLLIVAGVISVYVLFGRLASGQQDWRQQVVDFRSDNPHIRWRGALGLAQMLEADQQLQPDGTRLSDNREVATALANMLQESLTRPGATEEDIKQQEFLARTLGQLNVADIVLPALREALAPSHDREVRKNALASIALIAQRAHDQQPPFDDSLIINDVIAASDESDSLVRHTATFTLGLLPAEAARSRLELLTESDDPLCRINAAIGLARSQSLKGLPVFEQVLAQVDLNAQPPTDGSSLERALMLSNSIKALGELSSVLERSDRERFARILEPIAQRHPDPRVRVDAASVLDELRAG
jgi:hypothetical protein